ncbi:hypothetical protein BFR57_02025 [Idiomarina sp. MD25a]|uniref:Hpt domain-containing protein n=1 Tax=Idiomarina sp. MD25a TaxID=1889913 RepID=UPI0008F96830|nr:Hpt domain-containing protein [Idiomarina sp. MD25a]OIM99373.1 hypothetical protein BFR57_02025 [Idiomarina sp. MD25a]
MSNSNTTLIDFAQGLRHCDQQTATYRAVLQAFCEQYAQAAVFDATASDELIYHELHSLKGLSATIGAQPLSDSAADLFKNWTTIEKSKKNNGLADLQVQLDAVLVAINQHLKQNI